MDYTPQSQLPQLNISWKGWGRQRRARLRQLHLRITAFATLLKVCLSETHSLSRQGMGIKWLRAFPPWALGSPSVKSGSRIQEQTRTCYLGVRVCPGSLGHHKAGGGIWRSSPWGSHTTDVHTPTPTRNTYQELILGTTVVPHEDSGPSLCPSNH